jgi:hypothetical protein
MSRWRRGHVHASYPGVPDDPLAYRPPPTFIAALRDARAVLERARTTRDVRMIERAIDLIGLALSELERRRPSDSADSGSSDAE